MSQQGKKSDEFDIEPGVASIQDETNEGDSKGSDEASSTGNFDAEEIQDDQPMPTITPDQDDNATARQKLANRSSMVERWDADIQKEANSEGNGEVWSRMRRRSVSKASKRAPPTERMRSHPRLMSRRASRVRKKDVPSVEEKEERTEILDPDALVRHKEAILNLTATRDDDEQDSSALSLTTSQISRVGSNSEFNARDASEDRLHTIVGNEHADTARQKVLAMLTKKKNDGNDSGDDSVGTNSSTLLAMESDLLSRPGAHHVRGRTRGGGFLLATDTTDFNFRPGAHRIQGIDAGVEPAEEFQRQATVLIGYDSEELTQRDPQGEGGQGELVTASPVGPSNGVFVTARPVSWFRKNQCWLAGVAVIFLLAIVIPVVITATRASSPRVAMDVPTSAPTTTAMGIQNDVKDLILLRFVNSEPALLDESSPQHKAMAWVANSIRESPPNLYDNLKILQQYSLATLFISSGGSESTWNDATGWLTDTNECSWFGVGCVSSSVLSLLLPHNNLNGRVPPELAILSDGLLMLDLSGNNLFGSIPSEVGLLVALTYLSFSSNNMDERVPSELGLLMKLKELDLSENKLGLTLPTQVGMLTDLLSLDLRKNDLIGAIPSQVGLMSSLKHLDVQENRFTQAIPSEVGLLSSLETLNSPNNSLAGTMPSEIGRLWNLRVMELSNNFLFGSIPSSIGFMMNLEVLGLSSNLLTGAIPEGMGLLYKLISLRLDDNFLSSVPQTFARFLQSVRVLDLSNNRLSGSIVDDFWDLNDMVEIVDLSCNPNLAISISENIWDLTNLIKLRLERTLTVSDIPSDIGRLTNLEVYAVGDAETSVFGFFGSIPSEIGMLTRLRDFRLLLPLLGSVPTEMGQLTKLSRLILGSPSVLVDITGHFPSEMGRLTNLVEFRMYGSGGFDSLPSELGALTKLETFVLLNIRLTDSIPTIFGMLTNMKELNLRSSRIPGSIPSEFGRMTQLRVLNLERSTFTGPLPSRLWELTDLNYLNLHRSKITGSVPSELWMPTKLNFLDLAITSLSGSITSNVGRLTKLSHLDLSSSNFSGFLPSEIWQITTLHTLNLGSTNIYGSVSTEVGALTQLAVLGLPSSVNVMLQPEMGRLRRLRVLSIEGLVSGFFPTQIGSLRALDSLILHNAAALSGTLPSELGNLQALCSFELKNGRGMSGLLPTEMGTIPMLKTLRIVNSTIGGPIPQEFSQLRSISNLQFSHTSINGTIVFGIGRLTTLRTLDLSNTEITGVIPTEIRANTILSLLDLSSTKLGGTIPQELGRLRHLKVLILHNTDLTGSIPVQLCSGILKVLRVDCNIVCACCGECAPSMTPSTSLSPSSAIANPSSAPVCQPFRSIARIGAVLSPVSDMDDGAMVVRLPFTFMWRGVDPHSQIVVTSNGVIWVGNNTLDTGCCFPVPVELGGQYVSYQRIAVAQSDLDPASAGSIYAATDGMSFIVSWEGVPYARGGGLWFQAALYAEGTVELRWGQGRLSSFSSVAAGLEDDPARVSAPASGPPFEFGGITVLGFWPTNQCRTFEVTGRGGYVEQRHGQ